MMEKILWVMVCQVLMAGDGSSTSPDICKQADERIQQCRTAQVSLQLVNSAGEPIEAGRTVKIEQTNHAFLFGCNIFSLDHFQTKAENEAYARRFAELFNYATLPFYWWAYEKQQGQPRDDETDHFLQWCRDHQVVPKGHPLAWNWQESNWLPDNPEGAMQMQMARIKQCVNRFQGRLGIWDVVNEATEWDRPSCKEQAPILTTAIERMGVGSYIRQAFQIARQANPQATLVINDYIVGPRYEEKVLNELKDEKGRPLYDVVGIQCHQHDGAWTAETIWEICERFAKYGKPLHFTEATILSGQLGWTLNDDPNFKWLSTPAGEAEQAKEVERFYTVLFSHPAVEAITWWDLSDKHSWKGAPAGLIRADMSPKPAYEVLKKLIKGRWWTRTQAEVQAGGKAQFRGFFGDYRMVLASGDRVMTGTFRLDKKSNTPIRVCLK